ncbi:MAG: HNH endonuclease, partial [Polaromonas sp.]|nr:HNH endonuclease [Polaromonas sp.]
SSPKNTVTPQGAGNLPQVIKRRDNFACLLCGERGGRLNVHHIESWAKEPALRFSLLNLATLCHPCHIGKAHSGNVHRPPDPQVAETLRLTVQSACSCGTAHSRDVNAAKNILRAGLRTLAEGALA